MKALSGSWNLGFYKRRAAVPVAISSKLHAISPSHLVWKDGKPSLHSAPVLCSDLDLCRCHGCHWLVCAQIRPFNHLTFFSLSTERAALVDSAIAEVQEEFQDAQAKAQNAKLTPAQRRIREFKKSSKEARAQGMARLRFEDTVKRAEKKIIEQNRKALGQDVEKLSESYAQELVHTPGTVLTMEEMNEIYTATGCEVYADVKINCDATYPNHMRFRTANGQCNNKVYPLYGAAGTRMKRLRKAEYEDGISKVRGFTQLQLPITLSDMKIGPFSPPNPSPRLCSVTIVKDKEINDSVHTHMLMQWGQFMDHDLDSMPEYVENDCPHQCFIPESLEGRCAPFPIPYNDVAVEQFADNCLGFRRSLPACEYNETNLMQARQHFNSITHWIDGSTIYHHDRETQLRLRALIGGLLLVDDVNVPTGNFPDLMLEEFDAPPPPPPRVLSSIYMHTTCTSHVCHMHITCTPHPYPTSIPHIHESCTSHVYHMYITCTPSHAHQTPHLCHICTTCTPHVHYMHVRCMPHPYPTCIPHAHYIFTSTPSHVHRMYTTSTPHVHHNHATSMPHLHHMHTTCIPHARQMYATSAPHVP